MIDEIIVLGPLDVSNVRVLMCDADGTLFDSEGPAFEASAAVTNRMLLECGVARSFAAAELRRTALGRNFRSTAVGLLAEEHVVIEPDALERWVIAERSAAVERLRAELRPSPAVRDVLSSLSTSLRLSIVTSSALDRLDACVVATDLDDLFPDDVRFSAEDSLPCPTTKPDPAIYRLAGQQMQVLPSHALAVEDAVAGVRSACAAGVATIGNLHFVADDEREERVRALRDAGAAAIVPSWAHLARLLEADGRAPRFPAGAAPGCPRAGTWATARGTTGS
jgi:beta-phosphoglucomutase-like phosphatase (HAD superfamily)